MSIGCSCLALAALLMLIGADAPASQPVNLAANGDFEENTDHWTGSALNRNGESEREQRPDFVQHETEDTADDSDGALHIVLDDLDSGTYLAHQTGVACKLTEEVPKDRSLRVRFDAKLLKGPPYLNITRSNGGGSLREVAELSEKWTTHEVIVDLTHGTQYLIWNLVEGTRGAAARRVSIGSVLIDNVRVSVLADDQ
ncbi:MAG: hypothetical protein ACODAQ_06400 [Phycisphaeraceae bacterium]